MADSETARSKTARDRSDDTGGSEPAQTSPREREAQPTESSLPAETSELTNTLDRLLQAPDDLVRALLSKPQSSRIVRMALVTLLGFAAYGAIMGAFQGGAQIFRSMLKAPLVVTASLLLCLPSLYVFVGLSAGHTTLRRVSTTAITYAALLSVVLVGLLPIAWLFSTASQHLSSVVSIHLIAWVIALGLAYRVLSNSSANERVHTWTPLFLWTCLFFFVSLQMATHLRPLLWQEADRPMFTSERKFFLNHLYELGPDTEADDPVTEPVTEPIDEPVQEPADGPYGSNYRGAAE